MAASLERWQKKLYVFLLVCPFCVPAFLNLEELNEMKYGIQILPDPVILGQTKTEEVMMVSSKYKQLYECRLPVQALRFHQDPSSESESESQGYTGPDIPELLKQMDHASCLIKTKDWWTYEFCYGKHIRQYHLEDAEIKGDALVLGYFDSEFDWNNETAKASKQHKLKRYHSQSYVNGSKCDLNGNPRETEVRFVCEDGSDDYIARVDEPQSCRYVLTIHTSRTCQHPFLRPPSTSKPQGIVCQPALSAQQYMDYVKAQVSDTKRKVEQISEELKSLDEMLAGNDGADETVEVKAEGTSSELTDDSQQSEGEDFAGTATRESDETDDSHFWDEVTKPRNFKTSSSQQETQAEDGGSDSPLDNEIIDEDGEEKFNFKIITDPADLMKFVQHLKESNRKKAQNQEKSREERQTASPVTDELREKAKDEDEQLLQEFEEEMADLSVPSEKIEEIKEEMQKEFDNIINEAQQELETEGLKGEFDRTQATQTLETTLDKLLDHLEEKDVEAPEQQTAPRGGEVAGSSNSLVPKQPEEAADDHVKIKITKYKTGSSHDGKFKVQEMGEGDPQWQDIKDVVKEQLEKAGLKAEGKIEVKILTRKNAEEADDQWLTEEDTKSFRELLINLLTGGTEEVYKEQKRQQELENNYKFVWGENQEESQSSSSSDSDDMDI